MLVTLVIFSMAFDLEIVKLLPLLFVLLRLMLTRDHISVSFSELARLQVFIALVSPLVGQLLPALASMTLRLSLREETGGCLKHTFL